MGHTHSLEAPSNDDDDDDDARVSVFGFVTNGGDTGEMRIKRTHFIFFFPAVAVVDWRASANEIPHKSESAQTFSLAGQISIICRLPYVEWVCIYYIYI